MRPMTRPLALLIVGAVLLGGTGCGRAAAKVAERASEEAIESQAGDGAEVDIGDDGSFRLETEDGSYSAGTGEVPSGWPDDIALPDGLEVVTGSDIASGTEAISSIVATTTDAPAEIAAHFDDELADWDGANRFTSGAEGSSLTSVSYTSADRTVQVTIGEDADGTTSLSVSHSAGG